MSGDALVSRRRALGYGGVAAGGLVVGGVSGAAIASAEEPAPAPAPSATTVPFRGRHQAGIATPAQDRLLFASFDLTTDARSDVEGLLREWTIAAERMTQGHLVTDTEDDAAAPPADTGEAVGLHPAALTLTFGLGPTFFDRVGLGDRRPAALVDLPAFPGDNLDPARSGGDLCVQACGNDPQVLFHAIRNLARIGRGIVRIRWTQEGFGRTSSTTTSQSTPRNLMGFKDGTDNLKADTEEFAPNIWARRSDGAAWMDGGSYLVARRIRIRIEVWDRSSLADQEATIGRVRSTGAPLGMADEFAKIDLDATAADGTPVVPVDAHVRLANQDRLGIHILRRGYNFTDGLDPRVGQLDAGLFFLAFQRDPRTQFIPMQQKLAESDALNEYIQHVGSAVFAVLPGVTAGHWLGETLFA
ncbi:MAG: iron uptake transporter deferrochelatase/peroxidase subunit [Acidimicrobiales bacterium]